MSECSNCGAPMLQDQDWCVQCGAARPGLVKRRPGWLTAAGVLAVTVLLVAGASVAAYAALTKPKPKVHKQLALHTPTTVAPSTTPATPGVTPTTPTVPTTPATPNPSEPAPPKIPTPTPTPEGSSGANPNELLFPPEEKASKSGKGGKASKASKSNGSGGKGSTEGLTTGSGGEGSEGEAGGSGSKSGEPEGPEPILLDTNAASTYNPNAYPSTLFGDPSLTIDGEASTAWTAEVQASLAPQVNAGVVLDLRTAQKLGSVTIKIKTPGITIAMYGANGHDLPPLITDSKWKKLHGARLLKKKKATIKLKTKGAAYRFVLLWIVKAPASSTPADPGRVAIRELELFPPS